MLQELFTPSDLPAIAGSGNTAPLLRLDKSGLAEINLDTVDIAIMGVPEDTNAVEKGAAKAPDEIRNALYALQFNSNSKLLVKDFGNLSPQGSLSQTYKALSFVVGELLHHEILPVIIGGSQDLTVPALKGFPDKEKGLNLLTVDYTFDWNNEEDFTDQTYLNQLLFSEDFFVKHYANIGDQVYFIPHEKLEQAQEQNWHHLRLGNLRNEVSEAEPFVRYADFVSFDWAALRNAYLPGLQIVSPNGIEPHEACQIAKYAGMSDGNRGLGIFNFITQGLQQFGPALAAQMIWYYIDGAVHRTHDYPKSSIEKTTRFIVSFRDFDYAIIFFQSKRSNKWWMEVPGANGNTQIVPCSYKDYLRATKQEIPDLWYRYYQKFREK